MDAQLQDAYMDNIRSPAAPVETKITRRDRFETAKTPSGRSSRRTIGHHLIVVGSPPELTETAMRCSTTYAVLALGWKRSVATARTGANPVVD
jgi:hypothetical protein